MSGEELEMGEGENWAVSPEGKELAREGSVEVEGSFMDAVAAARKLGAEIGEEVITIEGPRGPYIFSRRDRG